ncbi:MAG: hypothetical protein GX418_08830 [Clostridiales bacterium]|nr:hypothetical protein [Clostridiales bacterium]
MKPKTEFRFGVGASSILMILTVLALAALALLSLVNARGNAALAARSRTMTVAAFTADAEAQRTLALMDEVMAENASEDWTPKLLAARLARAGLADVTLDEDYHFAFALDAGVGRELHVEGILTPTALPRYTLTRHQLVAAALPAAPAAPLAMP